MDYRAVWATAEAAVHALSKHYEPSMLQAVESRGLSGKPWTLLLVALTFAPDPLSTRRLLKRSPYTCPAAFSQQLSTLEQAGFLRETSPGLFDLAESGRNAASAIVTASYDRLDALAPLYSMEQLVEINRLLFSLVQESLLTDIPISKWSLTYSRRLDLSPATALLSKVDQYISDLAAFRDDAHIASWQLHPVGGHSWDILSLVWRNPGCTLDDIASKLSRRGWSPQEDREALDVLLQLQWVTSSGGLTLTQVGFDIREAAEGATDQYFFGPWGSLAAAELQNLRVLLAALMGHLQPDRA